MPNYHNSEENVSNHSPIYVKLDVGQLSISTEEAVRQKRTNWNKASEEERNCFKDDLANKLNSLPIPACVTCQNIHCRTHSEDIETYSELWRVILQKDFQFFHPTLTTH